MSRTLKYLDLFAGAGGLSEGFIRAGFNPAAHVEANPAACFTLRTRMAFHWLIKQNRHDQYKDYLLGNISRSDLYKHVPQEQINSVINAEIKEDSLNSIFKIIDNILNGDSLDLIIGGPPCQAYSVIGRSRDKNRMKTDKRNHLYLYYAEFLKKYNPIYFVFENVTGLLSAKGEDDMSHFEKMQNIFHQVGYKTEYKILSAEEYGVLQKRKRIILVGKRGKTSGFYPDPQKWQPRVKVNEVFDDLPSLHAGEGEVSTCMLKDYGGTYLYESLIRNDNFPVTWHQARPNTEQDLEIYKIVVGKWNKDKSRIYYNNLPEHLKTHRHRNSFLDRFKVVAADLPSSHTVVAHIAKDGHYYIHPDITQNRSITPREAARLQTFPDDYFFEGNSLTPGRTQTFYQIGNAVPVLLSTKIAQKLMEIW